MALMPMPKLFGGDTSVGRIMALLILLAACLAGWQRLREYARGGAEVIAADRQTYRLSDPVEGQNDPLEHVEAIGFIPKGIIGVDVGDDSEKALLRAHDIAGNTTSVEYAFAYMKGLGPQRLRELADTPENTRYSNTMLMQRSDELRGTVKSFFGIARSVTIVSFPDAEPGLRELWLVVAEDIRKTGYVAVLTPSLSELVDVGSIFAFEGIFIQRYAARLQVEPDGPGVWQWLPLFVSPRVYADRRVQPEPERMLDPDDTPFVYPPEQLIQRLDPNILDVIWRVEKDGSSVRRHRALNLSGRGAPSFEQEASNLLGEKVAFDHLFRYMAHFTPEKIRQSVDPDLTFEYLMTGVSAPPDSYYRFAEVTGHVLSVSTLRPTGLESGLSRFYVLVMNDARYSNFEYRWSIACPNLPPDLRLGDRVIVRGAFIKLYPHRNRKQQWIWTPLLTAQTVEIVPPASTPRWAIAAIGAGVIGVFFLVLRSHGKDEAWSRGLLAKMRRNTYTADPGKASAVLAAARERHRAAGRATGAVITEGIGKARADLRALREAAREKRLSRPPSSSPATPDAPTSENPGPASDTAAPASDSPASVSDSPAPAPDDTR